MRRTAGSTTLDCGHPQPDEVTTGDQVDCELCDRREIPPQTTLGRATPMFDDESVPPALLKAHQTNAWAELVVTAGEVGFFDEDPPWRSVVAAGERLVIVPRRAHHVAPAEGANFYVQFYDLAAAD